MNKRVIAKSLGILLLCEAGLMVLPMLVSLYYGEAEYRAFLYTIIILLAFGICGYMIKPGSKTIYARDGFAIVAFGWILISIFGGLPFMFSGIMTNPADAFFEASSGFTTTGATILSSVEGLPNGVMFWRSFTHWVGGMGVLVFTMAFLPLMGTGTMHIMKAESPGPNPGKLVPKLAHTAKLLYIIYIIITVAEIILLKVGGMSFLDASIHTFGTVGTGGFSNKNISVGAYNSVYIEAVITIFMIVCGVNFGLYYAALKGGIKNILKDEEFKVYFGIIAASIVLITINLTGTVYSSIGQSFRYSSFQVGSIITTTGYATTDFNTWPTFSKMILVVLMFTGACAGSTAGGMKSIRLLVQAKMAKKSILKIVHPNSVYVVRINGKAVDKETLKEVPVFLFLYMFITVAAILVLSLEGKDFTTTITAVAATMGNIGPGLGEVGPMGNFGGFNNISKLVMSFCMLLGRIEIYPILITMMPSSWRK